MHACPLCKIMHPVKKGATKSQDIAKKFSKKKISQKKMRAAVKKKSWLD